MTTRVLGLAAASMLLAAACVGDAGLEPTPIPAVMDEAITAEIGVQDQEGDGDELVVVVVTITGSPGWLVVHRDVDGRPAGVVGHTAIPEGTTHDVVVAFYQTQPSGMYLPVVHVDSGVVGEFEFPHPTDPLVDAPVSVDGELVMEEIRLTVRRAR